MAASDAFTSCTLGRSSLLKPDGFDRLFRNWGPEIIYWQDGGSPNDPRIAALDTLDAASTPTLVVGRLPGGVIHNLFGWAITIVGSYGGMHGEPTIWADSKLPVDRLIQPADRDWDDRWLA